MKIIATIDNENIYESEDGCVTYTAKAAVDCDGAGGNVWHDPCFQPETSLHHDGQPLNANRVAYIVVPPAIIKGVKGIVLGCKAQVKWKNTTVDAVVGDIGPRAKLGEISVLCARNLGMNPSPNSGGADAHNVHYSLWPGAPAVVDGVTYQLQRS